ncbi:MAG: type IA DNA topoisomerase [Lachnospiraceae bacterium]|nr:type IA DNA topoisomerase [Lachnospiraceae bacterium]
MGKTVYIAEKPSVAQEFARVLGVSGARRDGYIESEDCIITWCVGHLVTMSYPDAYDPSLKRWSMDTLPFLPEKFRYEVIDGVKKQFNTVKGILTRKDVDTIYVCTDSGREGEYIYRLVREMAGVRGKQEKRVWIDSQTKEEILRGIREAKDETAYDALSDAAYCRAREDYLMGINFSRALTLKFGPVIKSTLKSDRAVLAIGRVMTCVLGMIVRREREIRDFVKTEFFKVAGTFMAGNTPLTMEWRVTEDSKYFGDPKLYRDSGFLTREKAEELIRYLLTDPPVMAEVVSNEKKTEKKNPPLLFNLAELQNECSRRFKKTPDETLAIVQELYEKKLVTYPRTDARVLSTAAAREIGVNLKGLMGYEPLAKEAAGILEQGKHRGIEKSRYTDDKKITDHYAIIPTGQGLSALGRLEPVKKQVYDVIVRRFLSIFYPAAVYERYQAEVKRKTEHFFASFRVLKDPGWLTVAAPNAEKAGSSAGKGSAGDEAPGEESIADANVQEALKALKKGMLLPVKSFDVREGETSPPKRYTSGSLILAMENAGQLIEDEELRAQIKGSGIGTSATRAEILKKLENNRYIQINRKTQAVSPELLGELIFDVVDASMAQLLSPELTASWEKGLSYVSEGKITEDEYMEKLRGFVERRIRTVKGIERPELISGRFRKVLPYYKK